MIDHLPQLFVLVTNPLSLVLSKTLLIRFHETIALSQKHTIEVLKDRGTERLLTDQENHSQRRLTTGSNSCETKEHLTSRLT